MKASAFGLKRISTLQRDVGGGILKEIIHMFIEVQIDTLIKLKVFEQFYDGFSLPTNIGGAISYTYNNLCRSLSIVHGLTLIE